MMNVSIRPAAIKDRPRLLEISSQIWEGDDYVPDVVDAWIADPNAELAVAVATDDTNGTDLVVGFARRSRLASDYAWLEGARTDPGYRNRGVGRALLTHFLAQLRAESVKKVALSTYVENKASIHIIEQEGFRRAEEYIYAERVQPQRHVLPTTVPQRRRREQGRSGIQAVDSREGRRFLESLSEPVRFVPDGWKFIPMELGCSLLEARLELLGAKRERRLAAIAAISRSGSATGVLSIGLYAKDPGDARGLLDEAERRYPMERSELMIWPSAASSEIVGVARDRGYSVWSNGQNDVFVYERTLATQPDSPK